MDNFFDFLSCQGLSLIITSAVFSPLKPLIDNVEFTPGIVIISLHMLFTTSVERVNVAPS